MISWLGGWRELVHVDRVYDEEPAINEKKYCVASVNICRRLVSAILERTAAKSDSGACTGLDE